MFFKVHEKVDLMRETEVKARVNDIEFIKNKLISLGCLFSDPIIQNDSVFFENGIKPENGRGIPAFRIRDEGTRFLFTLKIPEANDLDKIEREMEITDPKTMKEMLELINFRETIRLNKKRIKCKYNGYEICLDDVEGLGQFIEVEKITDENAEKVQEELFNFLISLGVKKEDRVTVGYDTLLHRISRSKRSQISLI